MTRVNKEIVRATILRLHRDGWGAEAYAVWDLYDAHNENELELVINAGAGPAVAEVEELIAAGTSRIAGNIGERCASHYLSEKNEELVQCQRFAEHGGAHTHDLLGSTTGEYAWSDTDAFQHGQLEPVISPRTSPELPSVFFCKARYAGHPEHGNMTCGKLTGHPGDHVDETAGGRWASLESAIRAAQAAEPARPYKTPDGVTIFPGQISVEEQLLTLTRAESDNCDDCHKARQEFGDGFVCANHDA